VIPLLRPKRLRKFYIAVPIEYEKDVVEAIGRLGLVQLIETGQVREISELEAYNNFLRLFDRVKIAIGNIDEMLPRAEVKKPFIEKVKDLFTPPKPKIKYSTISTEELNKLNRSIQELYDKYVSEFEAYRRRLSEIEDLIIKIDIFRRHGIGLDIAGEYTHIFVKAGFIPEVNISKLYDALRMFNIILSVLEGREREKFILIAASQKDRDEIINILTMLNFEEIVLPEDLGRDPDEAYRNLLREKEDIMNKLRVLRNRLTKLYEEMSPYVRYVRFMARVRSQVVRTRSFSILYGWIPEDRLMELRSEVAKVTGGLMHIEESIPGKDEEAPTLLSSPPLIDKFQLITRMRGLPRYYEIDPSPFFMVLFSIMYGMMFGDVGQGLVLFIIGQILYRIKKPILGIPYRALNRLGAILSTASIASIIFGFLYGESFLLHFMEPLWLNPLKDPIQISVVAIIFGLIQIIIGLILYSLNNALRGDYIEAILGWRGLVGLIYYIVGIILAVRFIIGGMRLEVFGYPENLPLVFIELFLLAFILLRPTLLNMFAEHKHPVMETLMEGVGEFIEMFLSYITNSVSYVRLAAFAIAHVALAEVAYLLSYSIGPIPSYLIFNIIVILIEGFAAGIQSIRLLFYEFSTKFYMGDGRPFIPVRL